MDERFPVTAMANTTRRVLLSGAGIAAAFTAGLRPVSSHPETGETPIAQPAAADTDHLIARAFEMRDLAMASGDQPYGAIIATGDGHIVGQAPSRVVVNNDPSAHAEMEAIRDACRRLGVRALRGHVIYSSSRPCPMCEAAAYWAGLDRMVFGRDATEGGAPKLCG